jgi:hypothetical protein
MCARYNSLFSEPVLAGQGTSSFVVSFLIHSAVIGAVSYGMLRHPQIDTRVRNKQYAVRRIDLHASEQQILKTGSGGMRYPGAQAAARPQPLPARRAAKPSVALPIAQAGKAPQTLIQPEIPRELKLPVEIPVPTVAIWTPAKTPVKVIVPAQPQKPTAADVKPSAEKPNEELTLADISVSAAEFASKTPVLFPSATSPIVVHGPKQLQMVPVTTSESPKPPTPAAVLALSDLRMKEGSAPLPPANEIAAAHPPATSDPAPTEAKAKSGNGDGPAGGVAKEEKPPVDPPDDTAKKADAPAKTDSPAPPGTAAASSPVAGSGADPELPTARVNLPKNGQFGAVIVGAAIDEEFPEMVRIWGGRMAYTAYLHIGSEKTWVMQYSLPPFADTSAVATEGRLEAPWPFEIVKPLLTAGKVNADAVIVHAFVNKAGRFESPAVVYPSPFDLAGFVLNALKQWQFRPARQNGQSIEVEVVLVIPVDPD